MRIYLDLQQICKAIYPYALYNISMHVLLVEDDPILADGIRRSLRQLSYSVDWVSNGTDADLRIAELNYDAIILDLGLPGMDGLEVLRKLRKRGSPAPVMILTARDSVLDKVTGLDLGADDYLVKPFDLAELEARLRALIRRGTGGTGSILEFANLRYDMDGRRVTIDGHAIELSARELAVFELLSMRAGRVVSKDQLIDHLCERGESVYLNAVEVYVHRLRKKLGGGLVTIRTIRGLGYLLEKPRVI